MKRKLFCLFVLCLISFTGCALLNPWVDSEKDDSTPVFIQPGLNLKTIRGVLYIESNTGPLSLAPLASLVASGVPLAGSDSAGIEPGVISSSSPDTRLRPAKKVSGIENARVYALHDPDNFVFTDNTGKFELSVDMEKFKQWLTKNGIPAINDGSNNDISELVTIVAEKKEKQADGSELNLSTSIPVDCKNKIVVQLEDLYDKELHSQVKVRYSGHSYGIVTVDGLAAGDASILFYDTANGQIAYKGQTDNTGSYSVFPPPGHYRLVVTKDGCEPVAVESYEVKEKGKRKDDFNLKPGKNDKPAPVITFNPGTVKAPELQVKVNGVAVQNGQTVELDQNSEIELNVIATDNDAGLGNIIVAWNSAEWFRETGARQYSLSHTAKRKLAEAGLFAVNIKASDFDMIASMSPAQPGYFRIEVPQAGDAAFLNSIGAMVKGNDGTEKFRSILIPDANKKVGAVAEILVNPGDVVVPYIHVNTKNRTPREYDRFVGQFDANNKPVWKSEIGADGIALIGFEDLLPEFKPDYDYNDVYFKAWFAKEPAPGSEILVVSPSPSHQLEFSFAIKVKPSVVAPSAPINLAATAGNAIATLTWSFVDGAASYNVYYSTTAGVTVANGTKVTGAASPAEITGLTNGQTYYFIVTAVNAGGESAPSNEVSAKPQVPAPGAPINLAATAGNAIATLTWNLVDGAASYNVYYSTTAGVTVANGTKVTGAASPAEITGLTNGQTYYFIVTAVNAGGESAPSNEASAKPQVPAPGAPINLAATAGNAIATLTWNLVDGAVSYNVYYSTTAGATVANGTKVTGAATPAEITGLTNGQTYYFIVTAVNAGGESAPSNEASAKPQIPPPPAPENLRVEIEGSTVTVLWDEVAGAESYNLYWLDSAGVTTGNSTKVANASAPEVFENVPVGARYFRVSALNAGGESALSAEVKATIIGAFTSLMGATGSFFVNDACSDNNGNVYVTGYSFSSIDGQPYNAKADYFLIKYDMNGSKTWVRMGGSAGTDYGTAVCADSTGVYLLGQTDSTVFAGGGSRGDFFIVKYDFTGNIVWSKQYGTSDYEYPGEMAIDSSGLYVTGRYQKYVTTTFSETKEQVVLWKFDLSGNAVYSKFDSSGFSLQSVNSYGVAVLGGKVFQTVHQTSTAVTNLNNINTRLMRFDATTGDFEKRIDRNSVTKEYLGKIAADSTGIYVIESRWDSSKGYRYFIVVKYDTELNSLWSRNIDPLANASLSGISCLDSKVYVGGNVDSSAFIAPALGGSDGFGIFYSAAGNKFGDVKFGGSTNETVGGVVKTPYGLYFAGTVKVTGGSDIFLKKH